jgi:hypothetical protein
MVNPAWGRDAYLWNVVRYAPGRTSVGVWRRCVEKVCGEVGVEKWVCGEGVWRSVEKWVCGEVGVRR